jgi:hypothetical protein
MNTNEFKQVSENYSRAEHNLWGRVEILSQYQNSAGHTLQRVRLLDDSRTIRYTDKSNLRNKA